jgi:DNA-binding response OmpR family regulator
MKQIRIAIVDDDEDFAESMAIMLEGRGYEVELAYSGEEAIKKFREMVFDIVFMDVKLPGKNGVESFLEIRKLKPDAKVVMMTGFSVEQLLDKAVENGAWDVLHKPLDMKKVLEMLEKVEPDGILIADDDPDFVESIKTVLENRGKKVFVAKNGKDAIERVISNGIDILILDLRMPVLSGLETYLELKKAGRVIPTIIVTAFADEETGTIKRLRSMSVSGILRKPFDPRELLEAIERLSKSRRSEA